MKFTANILVLLLLSIGFACAKNYDLYALPSDNPDNIYLSQKPIKEFSSSKLNSFEIAAAINQNYHQVRIRVIDPPSSTAGILGFYLERPFFIIDGINLSLDESRTLEKFHEDANEFGIPAVLKSLGYTPILVQFTETVHTSLENNAKVFAKVIEYLNSNVQIPFPNKAEEGFIVLGISQGGIIGRYAAYLYDKNRSNNDAPIRMFASLDSPHQGAAMPRGLISTIDFWATKGGVAAAEEFNDLIKGPGARDLLLYETNTASHDSSTNSKRFLFGEYRKAAEYKEFPSILVSQGQLKGKDPTHANTYYDLNRFASLMGKVLGRASSHFGYSASPTTSFVYNRKYQFADEDVRMEPSGTTPFDFAQGSTYPFPQTMYESLRDGMMDAIPGTMYYNIDIGFVEVPVELNTEWETDKLYQKSSTFIPTVSAMDLKCNDDLAIRSNCAHNVTAKEINFENPEKKSTGKSIYGVDPTHPRYSEAISGRHIESPVTNNTVNQQILSGMQTDMWRVLCELAKLDYDPKQKAFRNPMLNGSFNPTTSCMDQSAIPDVIKNSGVMQTVNFAYARYDYNKNASEADPSVNFTIPAGWQKTATFNSFNTPPSGSIFEIKIKVNKPKSNWMKAELLLTYSKNGGGQIQLQEQDVKLDGLEHTLRWQLPTNHEALERYKWFRLVLNSDGAQVTLSEPKIVVNSHMTESAPTEIKSAQIYPYNNYTLKPWANDVKISETKVSGNNVLSIEFGNKYNGLFIDLSNAYSMDKFKNLAIEYVAGTCENTKVFFDSKSIGKANLGNNSLQNDIVTKILPLSEIINTDVTPNGLYSASRLSLQSLEPNEKCSIKSISLL